MQATIHCEFGLESAHRLLTHPGKCKGLHGHGYRVEVEVMGWVDPDTGMVVDFGSKELKEVEDWLEGIDHAVLLFLEDPLGAILQLDPSTKVVPLTVHPTAENLAYMIADKVREVFSHSPTQATSGNVTVWETETKSATVEWQLLGGVG